MRNLRGVLLFSLGVFLSAELRALDKSSDEALAETQKLLTDPKLRKKALENNEAATQADRNAKSVGMTEAHTEEIYAISADIMATLVKETDGDPLKLQELVQQALKNPDAFKSKLSPAQIQKIKSLASEIDAEKTKRP